MVLVHPYPGSHKGHLTPVLSSRHGLSAERKYGLVKPPHICSRVLSPTPLSYKERKKKKKKEKKKTGKKATVTEREEGDPSRDPLASVTSLNISPGSYHQIPKSSETETTSTKTTNKRTIYPQQEVQPQTD